MVQICCVSGCDDSKEDITYFKFPNSKTLRRKWLDSFTPEGKVNLDSVVCSQHFLNTEYELIRGKKRLKAKVVPSIFDEKKQIQSSPKNNKSDGKQNKDVPKANTQEKEKSDSKPNVDVTETTKSTESDHREIEVAIDKIDKLITDNKKIIDYRENNLDSVTKGFSVSVVNDNSIAKRSEIIETKISDVNKEVEDIEDIIINYHIKLVRPPLEADIEPERQEPDQCQDSNITKPTGQTEIVINTESGEIKNEGIREIETDNVIDVDNLKDPVFIEVSVDKTAGPQQPNQDCLMLLESVQCDIDPTSLMLHEDHDTDVEIASDSEERIDSKDPISLLTSSDEDDVIIEEQHIDTVEVSDETDEDDMPLVKLVPTKSNSKPAKSRKSTKTEKSEKSNTTPVSTADELSNIMWGIYEYYCVDCHFRTTSKSEYKNHSKTKHTTVIQICQTCGFTTASDAQFANHKRKHQDERKFKCHLCDYKARHNMSLIYHMKSHDKLADSKNGFKCQCGFKTNVKGSILKHIRRCTMDSKYACGKCDYETKRKSDLKRHKMRRHQEEDDDDDDDVSIWP